MTSGPTCLRLCELPRTAPVPFDLRPDEAARADLAERLDLSALKKLRLAGELVPRGKRDWDLAAELGATVVQPCVVTLAPVTTRIDETVARRFMADLPPPPPGETEAPEDDADPLPDTLDLMALLAEELALVVPEWPRAEGAALDGPVGDPPEKPFAALKALKDRMQDD